MKPARRCFLLAVSAVAAGARRAVAADGAAAWRILAAGGCAVVLRHAQTEPGVGDPPGFRLGDCATQRNLSEAGRAAAQRFGAEFARRRIDVDAVLSSRWCRCLETAVLAFPRHGVREFAPLDSFFADRRTGAAQTASLRRFLAVQPADRLALLVTHMVNIAALTGESAAAGEALLVRTGAGAGTVLGRLPIA